MLYNSHIKASVETTATLELEKLLNGLVANQCSFLQYAWDNFAIVHALFRITYTYVIHTHKYYIWILLGRIQMGPSLCLVPKEPFLTADSRLRPWCKIGCPGWIRVFGPKWQLEPRISRSCVARRAGVMHCGWGSFKNQCTCCRLSMDSRNSSIAGWFQPLDLTGVCSVQGWIAFNDYNLVFMVFDFM